MIHYFAFTARVLLLAICFKFMPLLPARAADGSATTAAVSPAAMTKAEVPHIKPGTNDGTIAFLTARLLQDYHFSHHRFDDTISSQFLDFYLESLDPQHLHFLQSDLTQFETYRTNLDSLTVNRRGVADVTPAYEVFSRFMERLQQR